MTHLVINFSKLHNKVERNKRNTTITTTNNNNYNNNNNDNNNNNNSNINAGHDGIHVFWFKKFTSIHDRPALEMNRYLQGMDDQRKDHIDPSNRLEKK